MNRRRVATKVCGMPPLVNMGAMIKCSFGLAPSTLIAIPKGQPVNGEMKFAATVMDFAPMANIPPFGMCTAPANPAVIAAKGAPVPCVPVTTGPWKPGALKTKINNFAALTSASTCMCAWAGVITVANPGTTKTMAN